MLQTFWRTVRIIGGGYLMVAAFLLLFFLWLKKGETYVPGLADPKWGLLIAATLVLPLLFPGIKKHILPRVHSIKVADFLEISLQELEVRGYLSEEISQQLQAISGDSTLSQTIAVVNSYSSVILDFIKELQKSMDEVLVVDFREGKAWIPPNLYFLALMLRYRTRVRQIVFVETREAPHMFIGSSSPANLEEALGTRFPIFRKAAENCDHQQRALNLVPNQGVGATFFDALKALYSQEEGAEQVRKLWLNSTRLVELIDSGVLHRERISWKEKLALDDYQHILASVQPYVAVVRDGQLESLVSRDRLGLRAARAFVEKSSG